MKTNTSGRFNYLLLKQSLQATALISFIVKTSSSIMTSIPIYYAMLLKHYLKKNQAKRLLFRWEFHQRCSSMVVGRPLEQFVHRWFRCLHNTMAIFVFQVNNFEPVVHFRWGLPYLPTTVRPTCSCIAHYRQMLATWHLVDNFVRSQPLCIGPWVKVKEGILFWNPDVSLWQVRSLIDVKAIL